MKWKWVPAAVVMVVTLFVSASAQDGDSQSPPSQAPADSTGDKTEQIQLGVPVHTVDPVIPKSLREKKAVAVLGATIRTDGSFDEVSVLGGDQEFEIPALDAVQQWRYTPPTLNAVAVEARIFVTVESNKGKLHARVEPDVPFPTEPRESIVEQISRGKLFRVGNGVSAPRGTFLQDPEYSEPAPALKFQGTCLLGVIVGADGISRDVWVSKKLGLGLDQKAIDAVRQWKFQPATKDGKPVAVAINVEVMFHLY